MRDLRGINHYYQRNIGPLTYKIMYVPHSPLGNGKLDELQMFSSVRRDVACKWSELDCANYHRETFEFMLRKWGSRLLTPRVRRAVKRRLHPLVGHPL